jgi:predicted DNA repair protein MutK
MDDVGLRMLRESGVTNIRRLGVFLLRAMPRLLVALSFVGTIAMLWVGGGIIVHGTHEVGFHLLYDVAHGAEHWVASMTGTLSGVAGWATYAAVSGVIGLVLGAIIAYVLHNIIGYEGAH